MDAAHEIAGQMKLPLYKESKLKDQIAELKILEGKAPYDCFDSGNGITERGEFIIQGVKA